MENSSAGQSMCIGGDGAGVAGLGPPFLSLSLFPFFLSFFLLTVYICTFVCSTVAAKEEACQHTAPLLVHPLRVKPTRERERPGD